jgi:hypothetical protein
MTTLKSSWGKLGAMATNADPVKKSAATKKAAATRKAQDPDCFKRMGSLGARKGWELRRQLKAELLKLEEKK